MKYWKYIELENWELICQKVHEFAKSRGLHRTFLFWNEIKPAELMEAVPELEASLAKLDVKCTYSAILVLHLQAAKPTIHIDEMAIHGCHARLQLPIANTGRSWTMFYTMPTEKMKRIVASNDVVHFKTSDSVVTEVDRVQVNQPTIIRISVPHAVRTGPIIGGPRITLTLRLDKDPVRWLNEDN